MEDTEDGRGRGGIDFVADFKSQSDGRKHKAVAAAARTVSWHRRGLTRDSDTSDMESDRVAETAPSVAEGTERREGWVTETDWNVGSYSALRCCLISVSEEHVSNITVICLCLSVTNLHPQKCPARNWRKYRTWRSWRVGRPKHLAAILAEQWRTPQ